MIRVRTATDRTQAVEGGYTDSSSEVSVAATTDTDADYFGESRVGCRFLRQWE